MDELEARKFLIELYNTKNSSHIGYFISLTILVTGILLSSESNSLLGDNFLTKLKIVFSCASPIYLYFVLRLKYWSAYTNILFSISPNPFVSKEDLKNKYKSEVLEDNIFYQFQRACDEKVSKIKYLNKIKAIWFRNDYIKVILFTSPLFIYYMIHLPFIRNFYY